MNKNKINDFEESTSSIKPLILLVQDREDARRDDSQLLKSLGCSVITAENANEALKKFFISPHLDLVFTDIDLVGSETARDKSGVDIARFIKHLDNELPIIGRSSIFEDNELSDNEKSWFDKWYSKGGMSYQALQKMFEDVKTQADAHKQKRFNEIADIFNKLKKNNIIDQKDFGEVLELAISYGTTPFLQIEEATSESGYELKLVSPKTSTMIGKPFLIWTKSESGTHETEVYGYSDLYSFGLDEEDALNNLLRLMSGFASDMKNESPQSFAGPALRLRKFLLYVLK